MRRILTLVVTYNEAKNIARLIPEILRHVPASSVLVVDDNSPDGTGDVVRALAAHDTRVEILSRPAKSGYGSATVDGIQHAVRQGYDVVATLDADFSHDPADLPRLIDALAAADVAIGSRYVGGIRILNWGVQRLLLSLAANSYVRFLSGLACVDCTSGFRAYRVDTLKKVAFDRISRYRLRVSSRVALRVGPGQGRGSPDLLHGTAHRQVEDGNPCHRRGDCATLGTSRPQGRPSH